MTTPTQTLIADVLTASGYELIEAEYVAARELWRVFLDRPDSRRGVDLVDLNDCTRMSDVIQDALLAAGVPFEHLEVSSPGMDRVLTKPDHFVRFAGDNVKLTIAPSVDGLRKLSGLLVGFDNDAVVVKTDDKTHRIPYAHVARARVVPQF
ncbi:MAG: ribosome maturation factor RimP [Burkholderiales bacterium]|nr:ribosome maturation factor RimP [Burkholderiales bacterium]